MNTEVISESFTLTDAIKEHIEQNIEKIKSTVQSPLDVHVFISKEAKHTYAVRFRTLITKKVIFSEKTGDELYSVISDVAELFKQQVLKTLKTREEKRKESPLSKL